MTNAEGLKRQSMYEFIRLVKMDVAAYDEMLSMEEVKWKHFVYRYIKTPGFKVTCFMRLCKCLENTPLLKPLYYIARIKYRSLQVKYGIQIGHRLSVGGGFTINHYGGIVIGGNSKIGQNFNIRNNLTIGHSGFHNPLIGDNVTVGAGAIIIGGVIIGNNVTIGAGAVVTKSFPNHVVIAGNPAKIIGENSTDKNMF